MTAAAVFVLSGLSGCHGKGQDTEGGPVVLEDASGEDGKEAKDGGVRDAGEDVKDGAENVKNDVEQGVKDVKDGMEGDMTGTSASDGMGSGA